MADKKTPGPKKAPGKKEVDKVTMQHIFNSLGQIEAWIHYVREALGNLDARMEIPISNPAMTPVACGPTPSIGCPPPVDVGDPKEMGCPPRLGPRYVLVKWPDPGCPPPKARRPVIQRVNCVAPPSQE